MVYAVRISCHIYLDIHLNIHLDVYLDIHLNVYLNVYRNVHLDINLDVHLHLYLILPPPHLATTPLHDLRFTTSLLSPSTQSKSIRWSCPPHLP